MSDIWPSGAKPVIHTAHLIPMSAEMADDARLMRELWAPIQRQMAEDLAEWARLESIGPHHHPDRTDIGPEHRPGRSEHRLVQRFLDAVRDTPGRPAGPPVWRAHRD